VESLRRHPERSEGILLSDRQRPEASEVIAVLAEITVSR
jgi:hypothetical protein